MYKKLCRILIALCLLGLNFSCNDSGVNDNEIQNVLDAPKFERIESADGRIYLEWNEVRGADIYAICWDTIWPVTKNSNTITCISNSFNHKHLKNNVAYFYKIFAYNTDCDPIQQSELSFNMEMAIPQESNIPEMINYSVAYCTEWPDEKNTGIAGAGLTEKELTFSNAIQIGYNGKITIDNMALDSNSNVGEKIKIDLKKSEVVIESLNVLNGVHIEEDCNVENIIIRKCLITEGFNAISIKKTDKTKVLIENCTIKSMNGSVRKGIIARNCIIRGCSISNYRYGVYITDNVVLDRNYFYDSHTVDSLESAAILCEGIGTSLIINNSFKANDFNASFKATNEFSDVTFIHIEHNLFDGGDFGVLLMEKSYGRNKLQDHLILNNTFKKDSFNSSYFKIDYNSTNDENVYNIKRIGNRDEFDELLPGNDIEL